MFFVQKKSNSLTVAVFVLALGRQRPRSEMIEFFSQMPINAMIFLTMAVLSLAAMLVVLRP